MKTKPLTILLATIYAISTLYFSDATANGMNNFEGTQCVAAMLDLGYDAMSCADTDLFSCSAPDWFPAEPIDTTEVDSYPLSDTVRYNEADYSAGSYTRWEHDWYSNSVTPYGPALSSYGHLWNEYVGTTLVKSVSCDVHGTVTYP
jgi:hypothetical protein